MDEHRRMLEARLRHDHRRNLEERLRTDPVNESPSPWRCTWHGPIGSLLEVGFAPDSDLLLVVSGQGLGVFDCSTGERVARDRDADEFQYIDIVRLTAQGIGPLEGQTVRMAGIWGGGLPLKTEDGWFLEPIALNMGYHVALLEPPKASIYDYKTFDQCLKVYEGDPIRACGFSETGRSFVVAQGAGISMSLFHR